MSQPTVLINGRLFVNSPEHNGEASYHDSMIIGGSNITYVGSGADESVQRAKEDGANIIDLENRVVVPSFIDSHVHMLFFGLSLKKLDMSACKSLDEIRSTISQYAKQYPETPRILCKGWMQSSTDGDALATWLDDLDPRPIFVEAFDLHSSWCSTSALGELPLAEMKAACGEHITCDGDGNPTGLVAETAQTGFVWPHLVGVCTADEKQEALRGAFEAYIEAGYAGVIDMAMESHYWEALEEYGSTEGLPIHIAAHWFIPYEPDNEAQLQHVEEAIAMHEKWHPSRSPDFCVVGVKLVCDGVVDGCTAALSYPYGKNNDLVQPLWPADALQKVVKLVSDAGLQCAIHAIGDAAITQAINAIASADSPRGRHRIEHLELATSEDAKRLGELGITASIQPVHSDPWLNSAYAKLIRPCAWERAFPYREFLDSHACVAIGTDAPTARHFPFPNLYNATTRKSALEPGSSTKVNAESALSLSQAVTAATSGAAYSRFAEGWTGSLKEGLRADFLTLDTRWTPESLLEARVYQNWSRGKVIYQARSGYE
ncbi:hypothetical protein FZEAL_2196 [Fusarium zealandicum]|uniref:Amidohydrolase 3 domain-containing protein n=1 Tax=Fusarium zealandicum TaxID=1053134 RepID=A0A8H4URB0_9HYPO|nr:hypothetical protein FZEAL_2196 [Fusarium zealandicum]